VTDDDGGNDSIMAGNMASQWQTWQDMRLAMHRQAM
jgi:hypothetical protein